MGAICILVPVLYRGFAMGVVIDVSPMATIAVRHFEWQKAHSTYAVSGTIDRAGFRWQSK